MALVSSSTHSVIASLFTAGSREAITRATEQQTSGNETKVPLFAQTQDVSPRPYHFPALKNSDSELSIDALW
jgi:hypothetical protein